MDVNYLPAKIKEKLEELAPGKTPISIVRSSGSLEGNPGEGYVIALDDKLFLFSRSIGEQDFVNVCADYSDGIQNLNLKNEKFNSLLEINLPDKNYAVKLSSFEAKDLDPLLAKWQSSTGDQVATESVDATPSIEPVVETEVETAAPPSLTPSSPPPLPTPSTVGISSPATDDQELIPLVGMASALMFLAAVDNEVAQSEDDYIRKVCMDNKQILKSGLKYYQDHTYDQLLNNLKNIDHTQKLCILANMVELAMGDGVLHSCEQNMIRQFVEGLHIDEEEYQAIKDVLLVKNQVSVLAP